MFSCEFLRSVCLTDVLFNAFCEAAKKKGRLWQKATNILLIFSCKIIKHIIVNILPTIRNCYNHGWDREIAERLKQRPNSVYHCSCPALAVFPCCTFTQMIEDTVCNLLNTLNDNGSICCIKTERQTKKLLFSLSVWFAFPWDARKCAQKWPQECES